MAHLNSQGPNALLLSSDILQQFANSTPSIHESTSLFTNGLPHCLQLSSSLSPIITLTVTNSISMSHVVVDDDIGDSGVVSDHKLVGASDIL